MEDFGGQQLLVQYFERARIELHPNNPQAYRVLQGRLGSERHASMDDHNAALPGPGHDDGNRGHDDGNRGHDDGNHGGHP